MKQRERNYKIAYALFVFVLLAWDAAIVAAPLLAMIGNAQAADFLYLLFKPTCHQLPSRSFCFSDASIADCPASASGWNEGCRAESRYLFACGNKKFYEFPVCARDVGVYFGLLLGALAYPLLRRIDSSKIPPILYLILSIIPLAIDGTGQLVGLWESTNLLRLTTGLLFGTIAPFYFMPMFGSFIDWLIGKTNKK